MNLYPYTVNNSATLFHQFVDPVYILSTYVAKLSLTTVSLWWGMGQTLDKITGWSKTGRAYLS